MVQNYQGYCGHFLAVWLDVPRAISGFQQVLMDSAFGKNPMRLRN